jgi:hypothetical protein
MHPSDKMRLHCTKAVFFLIRLVGGGVQIGFTRHVGSLLGDCEDGKFGGMKIGRGNQVLGENLPQRYFVHNRSHLTRPGPQW